ncbi:hypothetical protein GUJ93_ZPchr0010g10806 [Zizania palustris]|uniref:Sphingomyelin synthase-like domain-containing protein n=1 Tax=Zizania palustris TaxID=103762 RepID=A0A8J5WAB8_ZIZPA|nr:hypothetical protein GUJ93_ZPchr0010g10806 [Zizania palustris]
MNRAVSFEYMNRQLVWNEFSVLLLLPANTLCSNKLSSYRCARCNECVVAIQDKDQEVEFALDRAAVCAQVVRRITSETSVGSRFSPRNGNFSSRASSSITCMVWLLEGFIFASARAYPSRSWLHDPSGALGKERGYISETLFTFIFLSFVLWTFHPFILQTKRFYTVLIWRRVLSFLCASQFLRIVTFYSTQLPGPNYHCREGSPLARLPPPQNVAEVLLINFPRGVIYGCGDLIFSSHMIFTLVYGELGCFLCGQEAYRIDISTTSEHEGERQQSKDEKTRLLNGNSVDAADWRSRAQMNGNHVENGNQFDTETTKT